MSEIQRISIRSVTRWAAMKMKHLWIALPLIVLFCFVTQYFGVKMFNDNSVRTNDTRNFGTNVEFDDEVRSVLGKTRNAKLAFEIGRQLKNVCRAPISNNVTNQVPVYVVTPTYPRPAQQAELVRMAQTLMLVPNIYWLVIEDAAKKTALVTRLLKKWRSIRSIHLLGDPKPKRRKLRRARGVNSRNRALRWIRENATDGVFYFADDDNTYSIDLFEEIRSTKKVSMFPVGLGSETGLSSPVVENGRLIDFHDFFDGGRKYRLDMAGFAVNVKFFKKRPKAWKMLYREGHEEDSFLQSLSPFEPPELKAHNCTKILVWHTRVKRRRPGQLPDMSKFANTNLVQLVQSMV